MRCMPPSEHDRPRARTALDDIPAYRAGRSVVGPDGVPLAKLSSNELPFPPFPEVVAAIARAAANANRYPDPGCNELREVLAERHGVTADRIVCATGSVAVVYHLLQAFCEPGDEVVYAWRSFEAFPIAAQLVGARSVRVPLSAAARHDVAGLLAAVTDRTRVLLACTPNNPTGPAITQAELTTLADQLPGRVLLVIDEAYEEFASTDPAVAGRGQPLLDRPNVVSLRTFSKAYALAGFRVGYGVASTAVAQAVGKAGLPFGVSGAAQAGAIAALGVEDQVREQVASVIAERARVLGGIRSLGLDVPDSQSNFVWLGLGRDTTVFAEHCESAGCVVRPFVEDGVRISIGTPVENDLLVAAVAAWVNQTSPH
jgi:histidinol-phosphate aminotransferase